MKHHAADIYTNALFSYYNKMKVLDSELTKLTQHLVVTHGQKRKVKEIILLATQIIFYTYVILFILTSLFFLNIYISRQFAQLFLKQVQLVQSVFSHFPTQQNKTQRQSALTVVCRLVFPSFNLYCIHI